MVDIYNEFFARQNLSSYGTVYNAYSTLLIDFSKRSTSQPANRTVIEIELTSAGVANDDSLDVSVSSSGFLRRGAVLHFAVGVNFVTAVVSADTSVTTATTTVPVEPLAAAIATGSIAQTFGLYRLLAPISIPISTTDSKVNRTDMTYGLQGAEVKAKTMYAPQIETHNRLDDDALWRVIYPASQSTSEVFAAVIHPDGQMSYGFSMVSGWTKESRIEDISRPQFTLDFQAPYSMVAPKDFISSPASQANYETMRRLFNLPVNFVGLPIF